MTKFILKTIVLIGALGACPAALLQADLIYTDLGSGFDPGSGDTVSSDSSDLRPSVEFSPSVNEALIEVDFVTSIDTSTDPNDITVTLSSDSVPGGNPGTVIASQEFNGIMGISGSVDDPPGIISWDPSTELDLVAGTEYWITLDGPANSNITWNYNQAGAFGYTDFESGGWTATGNTLGAIDIIGGTFVSDPSTPEPGTALLLGLGLMAAIGLKRRSALVRSLRITRR